MQFSIKILRFEKLFNEVAEPLSLSKNVIPSPVEGGNGSGMYLTPLGKPSRRIILTKKILKDKLQKKPRQRRGKSLNLMENWIISF
jgi:hypothetical protein